MRSYIYIVTLLCNYCIVYLVWIFFIPLLFTKLYAVQNIGQLSAETNQLRHIEDNLNVLDRIVRISFREVLV